MIGRREREREREDSKRGRDDMKEVELRRWRGSESECTSVGGFKLL